MQSFTFMSGIPGSGKSFFAKKLYCDDEKNIIITPDNMRVKMFGRTYNKNDNTELFKLVDHEIECAISDGYNVVLDAMNLYPVFWKKYFQTYLCTKVSFRICIIDCHPDEAYRRVCQRNKDTSGVLTLPSEVYRRFGDFVLMMKVLADHFQKNNIMYIYNGFPPVKHDLYERRYYDLNL